MKRERISLPTEINEKFNAEVIYYFAMRAFKFPTGDDVHFFCSVDISPDYNFPELCPIATLPRKVRRVISTEIGIDKMSKNHNDFLNFNNEKLMPTIHELTVFNTTFVADDLMKLDNYEQIKGIFKIFFNNYLSTKKKQF